MSDTVKAWIEERRAIQGAARPFTETDPDDFERSSIFAESADRERVEANITASNDGILHFPRALDALNAVRELHKPIFYYEHEDSCTNTDEDHRAERHVEFDLGEYYCEDLPTGEKTCDSCWDDEGERVEWPCPTVQAVQAAIAGGR